MSSRIDLIRRASRIASKYFVVWVVLGFAIRYALDRTAARAATVGLDVFPR